MQFLLKNGLRLSKFPPRGGPDWGSPTLPQTPFSHSGVGLRPPRAARPSAAGVMEGGDLEYFLGPT